MKVRNDRGMVVEATETADRYLSQGWTEVAEGDACPTCGASGDDSCVTTSGNETAPHVGRN